MSSRDKFLLLSAIALLNFTIASPFSLHNLQDMAPRATAPHAYSYGDPLPELGPNSKSYPRNVYSPPGPEDGYMGHLHAQWTFQGNRGHFKAQNLSVQWFNDDPSQSKACRWSQDLFDHEKQQYTDPNRKTLV